MAVNAIQGHTQLPKIEQHHKVQQHQQQQAPEKPKDAPAVKQQVQTKGTGHINTFA